MPIDKYGLAGWADLLGPSENRVEEKRWMRHGKCFNTPGLTPQLFFPEPDDPKVRSITIAAKKFCKGEDGWSGRPCPAISACLEYALKKSIWDGVFGGMSGRERRKLSAERNRAPLRRVVVPQSGARKRPMPIPLHEVVEARKS